LAATSCASTDRSQEAKSMKMTDESMSRAATALSPLGSGLQAFPSLCVTAPGNIMTAWPKYMVDALQRSILFLDLLRRRGNEEIEITSLPLAAVLSFGHEIVMSGWSLPRPVNYALLRILPPPCSTSTRWRAIPPSCCPKPRSDRR
jgi:hypothetical protein